MSCSISYKDKIIKWKISKDSVQKLYPFLLDNKENAGEFYLDIKNKKTTDEVSIVPGQKDSTVSPLAMVNYHAHPSQCYISEKCVYGFPSGEDGRESVIFGLKGNITHVIPAIEGFYVYQVNPCILQSLINLQIDKSKIPENFYKLIKKYDINNFYRGLIITCIEVALRAGHAFRIIKFCTKYNFHAIDYLKYINNFRISDIFASEGPKIKRSKKKLSTLKNDGLIKNEDISTFEGKLGRSSFSKYVNDYEGDEYVYLCDKEGNVSRTNIKMKTIVKHGGHRLIKDLEFGTQCKYNKKLQSERWFLVKLYKNAVLYNGQYQIYDKLSVKDKIGFLQSVKDLTPVDFENNGKPYIVLKEKPVFYFFDLNGECNYGDIKSNLNSNKFGTQHFNKNNEKMKIVVYGSKQCKSCEILKDKLKGLKNYEIVYNYYPTIEEAIKEVQKIDKTINKIPAIFKKIGSDEL